MSTDPRQERTLGQLVASASQDISTLVRSEIALAKAEVSVQLKKAGAGGGLLAAAAVIAFYSVYFLFTTIVEGLIALGLWRWLSYLIVTVLMLAVAALLAYLGSRKMKTVQPAPEKAIESAQETVEGIKAALAAPGTMPPAPRPPWDTSVAARSAGTPGSTPTPVSPAPARSASPDPSRDA